jgi:hypothetical protein
VKGVRCSTWGFGIALFAVAACGSLSSARADEDPWAPGTQWMSVRAGFANSSVRGSGDGSAGFGFGYSRVLRPIKLLGHPFFGGSSLGGYVHYEILARMNDATEVEIPVTVELVHHLHWKSPYRPYFGLGGGGFYRKTSNTGADLRVLKRGYYVVFGSNAAINSHQLIGLDVRLVRVEDANVPSNPVFGAGSFSRTETTTGFTLKPSAGTHWSVKLNWSLAY